MTTLSVAAARATFSKLVESASTTHERFEVTRNGNRAAVLMGADDYDGLVQVAEDQVNGGAHVLDICVALTERADEDVQMREVVQRISLTQPAPIQIDSTEPEVIEAALEAIPPGRPAVVRLVCDGPRHEIDLPCPGDLDLV